MNNPLNQTIKTSVASSMSSLDKAESYLEQASKILTALGV